MSQTQAKKNDTVTPPTPPRRRAPTRLLILTLLVLAALVYALIRTGSRTDEAIPANPTTPIAVVATTNSASITQTVQGGVLPPTAGSTTLPADSPLETPATGAVSAGAAGGALLSPLAASKPTVAGTPGAPPVYTYEVVNVYPHDPNAYTQGLVFDGETLYEGTGLNGRSSLRRVELATGEVQQQVDLEPDYFGEGIVVWEDQIVQLTWQSQLGFVYDKNTFERQRTFTYPTQGWGITHDGRRLIMSDGSSTLYFWAPETLTAVDAVDVYDLSGPVNQLNELEYVKGEVYANIWQTDSIARIDPVTGQVLGWIDLSGLLTPEERAGADVLNGIAYLPLSDQLFVTGKLWPKLFEIRLVPDSSVG